MAIRTAFKLVTHDYRSAGVMAAIDSQGYATPGELSALNLIYTVGTQVTPDPNLEHSVKAALIAAHDANPTAAGPSLPGWYWLGPDASAGIRIEPHLAVLIQNRQALQPQGRIIQLQYDDADVLLNDGVMLMLRTAYVLREVAFDGSGRLVTVEP